MSNNQFNQSVPVGAVAITPHDTTVQQYSMIYVGGTGNVKITGRDGVAVTFVAVPAGQYIPVMTQLVWSTGTTATSLVGIGN